MDLTIKINCDGAAFEDEYDNDNWFFLSAEVKRLLQKISSQIEDGNTNGTCIDIFSNKVGNWTIE